MTGTPQLREHADRVVCSDEDGCEREATHTSCDDPVCPAHVCRCSKRLPGPVPLSERCHYAAADGRPCDQLRGHDGEHEALWDAPTYQALRAVEPRHAASAKVAPCPLCRVPVPQRLPAVGPLSAFAACPGCHTVLVWRASDEWEATGLPTRGPEPSAWQREAMPDAPRSAARPAQGVSSSVVQRATRSPESAHASDEAPSHSGTPPRGPCQEGSSSGPAAAEKRLDTMSGNFDPTTKTTQRHTRRGPSPYPGCTHPDAMLSGYIEQLAETPWPVVHTGAICGRCGAVDVVPVWWMPDPSNGGGDSPHAPAGRLAVSQREAFVAAMDGAIPDHVADQRTSG